MATVRIYRVAELLNTSSQEVMALLKRDHGIDVKSASSTIEEVVARQFVERLARQRNITVPSSASFADTPTAVRGRKPAPKAAEPQRPAAPALPPPRLVKTAKPVAPPPDAEAIEAPAHVSAPELIEFAEAPAPESIVEVPEPVAVAEPVVEPEPHCCRAAAGGRRAGRAGRRCAAAGAGCRSAPRSPCPRRRGKPFHRLLRRVPP